MPQQSLPFLIFVAVFVALFWRLRETWQSPALALGSALFLLALDPLSCAIVGLASVGVWACAGPSRRVFRIGLIVALSIYAGVKAGAALDGRFGLPEVLVPLGFGFYVPKVLHLWIDGDAEGRGRPPFLLVLNFLLFFPTILVGPIHRLEDFQRGERRRRWDPAMFAEGLRRILYGYFKVVVLANYGVTYLLRGFLFEHATPGTSLWVFDECLLYGANLYLLFAGFSDVAIGVARLLGQDVGENFNRPFMQPNLASFWRCWHISLSNWCRRYVFTPALARWRSYTLAVLLTMLAIGAWHEFTARYILWGAYHGAGLAIQRVFSERITARLPHIDNPLARGLGSALGIAATLTFVIAGFAITKNSSLGGIVADFRTLLGGGDGA